MIPNIVKGKGVTGLLAYVMGQGNDRETGLRKELEEGQEARARILGGQNFGYAIDSAERLEIARRDMEWNAQPDNQHSSGRKCEKDALHASLSWEAGQEPTADEMRAAAQGFLKSLGMESAQAIFVAHDDTEHHHLHIIASRIDPATGKTFSQEDDFAKGQAWSLQWEREHGQISQNPARQRLHKMVDAIEARDGAAIVGQLTEGNPTFTARELDKVLSYGTLSKEDRAAFRGEILAQKNVVGLRETADSPVTRYTTRDVLAAEMGLQRNAQHLADDRSHGLKASRIEKAAAEFTLKPEQADALRHLTGKEGFAVLWGEAGTGKSHTLKATRAAYEAAGKDVIGLAWTNDVVQQMRGDGFKEANTIASELSALEKGRAAWNKNTVLIVDEAAMVSTGALARVAAAAKQSGAKLILAGDDAQLSSIEKGGMFETLRQTHGAAVLQDVQRVQDAEQKTAFNRMHKGEFRQALATFDKAGGIHWTQKQTDALRDMAARYASDVEATPDKRRFMFAFTNAEVATLNEQARALHKQRGDLGDDTMMKTASGAAEFATGDRIQFTGNGYGKAQKNAGLTNGRVGTITGIDASGASPRLSVALDTAKGAEPQSVSFTVGADGKAGEFDRFKHGYAGTIYRGQGRTLDESYVCHSSLWRSSAAYVALTRHREGVQIFAAHETVKDLDAMAQGLARPDNKRAATAYQIESAGARAELEKMVAEASDRQPVIIETPARSAAASTAATVAESIKDFGSDMNKAGAQIDSAVDAVAAPVERAVGVVAGAVAGLANLAEGVGDAAERMIDGIAGFLGGGSSAPPPKQEAVSGQEPPVKQTLAERIAAFREAEKQRRQEIARGLGARDALTEEELQREKEAQEKRSRDRGGGISH